MYTAEKRRVREAEKRVERMHYKFITDYVKSLHNDTFVKAEELYRKIRRLYPHGVKDLTKTAEYMEVVTPDKAIPRYYASRKTVETNTEMEMVLQIPLIPSHQTTRSTTPQAAEVLQPPAAEVLQPQAAEVLQPPAAEVLQPPAAEVLQPPAAEVLQPPAAEVLQPLPEETYEKLLEELRKDPELMRILNDLPLDVPPTASQPLQSCDVPNQELSNDDVFTYDNDMVDAIMPDDISPLEKELYFY